MNGHPWLMHTYTHLYTQAKKALMHGVSVDIHEIIHTDETVGHIHASAEVCRVGGDVFIKHTKGARSQ